MKAATLSTMVLAIIASVATGREGQTSGGAKPDDMSREQRTVAVEEGETKVAHQASPASANDKEVNTGQAAPSVASADVTEQDEQSPALTATDASGPADQKSWLMDMGDLSGQRSSADDGNPLSLGFELAANDQTGQTPSAGQDAPPTHKGGSLEEINNKLNNPGADLAQLNFKFIWNQFEGDLPGSSSQDSLTLLFQPVLPFKLPDDGNLIVRPTIPLTWSPYFQPGKGGFGEQFGLGDFQLNAFYSRTDAKKGYMWGLGAVMQAPTHTAEVLGKDQFQLGPAGFAGLMGKWGSAGVFPQHLWNIGGSGEGYTALTVVQPWYWFSVGDGWQVGGSPIIEYDWAEDNSDQAWTVPVNLGVARTIMIGKTPVKLKLEAIYYIVQPDDFGPCWGLQLTITPVVPNVFEGLFK